MRGKVTKLMKIPEAIAANNEQVLAFRLDGHNLAIRLPPGFLPRAAGACGIQNTPPGSAALSLHARVDGLTPADVDEALEADRTLLQTFSLRGATYVFPTADAAVFTRGVLPEDEASIRFFILGAIPAFDKVGISAIDAIRLTSEALYELLDGRAPVKRELAPELADKTSERLSPEQLAAWKSPSWYAEGQQLGEAIVRFCLYVIALEGAFCFATRHNMATYIRTDQWLGAPLPPADPSKARAELVRRYLSCYGPSTAAHFAEWAGIAPAQADAMWRLVEGELAAVDFEGRDTWLLKRDISRFTSPQSPEGVRFLPPHDPYLLLRDRATLIPDKALHRLVWRSAGNPGIVLVEGKPAATWRPVKKGKRLLLTVEPLGRAPRGFGEAIVAEAEALAQYRGCTAVGLEFKKAR
jgi:hypothetical protein